MPNIVWAIKVKRRDSVIWHNYLSTASKHGLNRLKRNASQFENKADAEATAQRIQERQPKFECKVVKLW